MTTYFLKYIIQYLDLLIYKKIPKKNKITGIIVFDTSLSSDNLGDEIINYYCNSIFNEVGIMPLSRISTHVCPTHKELKLLNKNTLKIITGTNILSSKMNSRGLWKRPLWAKQTDNLCLMGTGWNAYSEYENRFTKLFYQTLLNKNFIHSVRDTYTENKIRSLGINNVIYTACPSMWRLSEDFCKTIPADKAKSVLTTITDYAPDAESDWFLLDTLLRHYKNVYIWIQGKHDLEYLRLFPEFNKLICIDNNLHSYNQILENTELDYVGTRLHAGIHALNHRKRTLIISIDNRARELAKDTNLPVIERSEIKNKLEKAIKSSYATNIRIPLNNIEKWKGQFSGLNENWKNS